MERFCKGKQPPNPKKVPKRTQKPTPDARKKKGVHFQSPFEEVREEPLSNGKGGGLFRSFSNAPRREDLFPKKRKKSPCQKKKKRPPERQPNQAPEKKQYSFEGGEGGSLRCLGESEEHVRPKGGGKSKQAGGLLGENPRGREDTTPAGKVGTWLGPVSAHEPPPPPSKKTTAHRRSHQAEKRYESTLKKVV